MKNSMFHSFDLDFNTILPLFGLQLSRQACEASTRKLQPEESQDLEEIEFQKIENRVRKVIVLKQIRGSVCDTPESTPGKGVAKRTSSKLFTKPQQAIRLLFECPLSKCVFNLAALMLPLAAQAASPICADQKKEDACGLANISSHISGNWNISADFLAWYASEQASAVWVDILEVGNNTSSFGAQDFSFHWDFGFRLGAGYYLDYDQWDTQLYWTWFRTEAHQSQNVPITKGEIHPEFFAADLSDDVAQSAKIRWALLFNMFDWELGRSYWVSKGLSLRPFIGLKGGWIHQPVHVQYNDLTIKDVHTSDSGREHAKNNFWGIGPLGGLNTKWKLRNFGTHYPSFFGDFSAATLWGTWVCTDVYKNTAETKVVVNMKKSTLGALMLRGFLGLGWDVDFCKGRSHFATRLGYEMQLWVNQLRLPTSQLIQLHGDLTLQGLTFNCRFDF